MDCTLYRIEYLKLNQFESADLNSFTKQYTIVN